jgi:hypothetical protein
MVALVLRQQWKQLFMVEELYTAKKRLQELTYHFDPGIKS